MRCKLLLLLSTPLLLVGLNGCSAFSLLNAASPSSHYQRTTDIRYGTDARQRLDLYVPENRETEALIVFFYGGGWTDGSKDDYRFVASSLTERGYAVAIPDYRLHPAVTFPSFVEDGAAALKALLHTAISHEIPSDPVFLMGHSAGAHIAALLAYDERFLEAAGMHPDRIEGFIGLSGPYDFLPIRSGYLLDVFPEPMRADSQPLLFADADSPPTLLIHGTEDSRVDPANSLSLASRLTEVGVEVDLRRYAGAGHARTVAALAPPLRFLADTLEDTDAFIRRILGSRQRRATSAIDSGLKVQRSQSSQSARR